MLSPAAFNALLKTLEEPPPHAKFVFATTEIRKVPVTVLSRCQRFDLRRVETGTLIDHLEGIAGKEGIEAEPAALALVARAAEGSVRDALSLFDQAIAHAAGSIRARGRARHARARRPRPRHRPVRGADEGRYRHGPGPNCASQYDSGADPSVVLSDLAEFAHFVTRVKIVPAVAEDLALAEDERTRGRAFATALSMRVLSRTWQMLLKGIAEVRDVGPAGRRRGDGAGAHRLCRRPADAGRGAAADRGSGREAKASGAAAGTGAAGRRRSAHGRARHSQPRAARISLRRVERQASPRSLSAPQLARAAAQRPRPRPAARRRWPSTRSRHWWRSPARSATSGQDGAGARRAARALRGRDAGDRARSRAPRKRWSTICRASSSNGPAGRGKSWSRARRARRH